MPIPIGQAATWNPGIVSECAAVAAREASRTGVNWTFAPMIDVTRDPRWGRIAESLGEDPHLASELGVAMVEGFQGDDLASVGSISACAKHFAGYGAAESGRDYATTNIPENLPQFVSDHGKLQQIFLNLVNNAFSALSDGGTLEINARYEPDEGIVVTVKDDGCGIPEADMERIFEPFFSTKKDKGGTGLGLSITYGLVQEIDGSILVESELGKGTLFTITLPIDKDESIV